MGVVTRLIRAHEMEQLQRFLERSFGHARGFFLRHHPDLQVQATDCSLVMEEGGRITGHVAGYPLTLRVGPAEFTCGGIGAVAVDPQARGQGHMSRLMQETIERMRRNGWPLSVLWGDQQRYQHFGYQACGTRYTVRITRRSLSRAGIKTPASLEEVDATDKQVLARIAELEKLVHFGVRRDRFPHLKMQRPGTRVFLGADGYLISNREYSGDLEIAEIVSPTERLAEMVLGALNLTYGDGANLELPTAAEYPMSGLWTVASNWRASPQGLFRIVDWPRLLQSLVPYLTEQARGVPPFAVSVGCRWPESVEIATVTWDGTQVTVTDHQDAPDYVELDGSHLVGLLLGGPFFGAERLGPLRSLLPIPVHIPSIDHV